MKTETRQIVIMADGGLLAFPNKQSTASVFNGRGCGLSGARLPHPSR